MSRVRPENIVQEAWRPVSAAVARARQRLVIVSPWVSQPAVAALVQALSERAMRIDVQVIFRSPADATEAPIVDPGAIRLLLQHGITVGSVPKERHLHAKVVLVDDEWALVGSGNFTERGLNLNGPGSGNLELGVEVRGRGVVPIGRWVRELEPEPFGEKQLAALQDWKDACTKVWNTVQGQFPALPLGRADGLAATGFVEETLRGLGINAHPVPGAGRNCWSIRTPPPFRGAFKAHVSDQEAGELHFEVTAYDIELSRRKPNAVDGLMYVAGDEYDHRYRELRGWPRVVLVPFSALFHGRRGLMKRALDGHGKLKVVVAPDGAGYVLRIPRRGGAGDDLAEAPLEPMKGLPAVLVLRAGTWR